MQLRKKFITYKKMSVPFKKWSIHGATDSYVGADGDTIVRLHVGPSSYDIKVQGQLLADNVTTTMEEKAPYPSIFLLGLQPPYGVTVQGEASAAAVTMMTGETKPVALWLFGFALSQPPP